MKGCKKLSVYRVNLVMNFSMCDCTYYYFVCVSNEIGDKRAFRDMVITSGERFVIEIRYRDCG